MEAHRHRRHPLELKLRLVQAYLSGEGSLQSLAKANDITHTLLSIWVDKYRRGELADELDQSERQRDYEAKIAALERKVGQLTMEIDLLKQMKVGSAHGVDALALACASEGAQSGKETKQ
jgi:transposase